MTRPSLTLSRSALTDFLACQRRFQLRYLQHLPWPQAPLTAETKSRLALGDRFHQLVERYYLELPITSDWLDTADEQLQNWWNAFLRHPPARRSDATRLLTEATVTVPLGQHDLIGRFDLLMLTTGGEVHIYDWKTGRPRSVSALRQDWQTRLYLALATEGRAALGLPELTPEQVRLTYWYAQEPTAPRVLTYDTAVHETNWQELTQIVTAIDQQLDQPEWPLTPNLETCTHCAYRAFCGRFETPQIVADILEEREFWADAPWEAEPLEPEI